MSGLRYHPLRACAWCGNGNRGELVETLHKDTFAACLRCTDPVECVRRQYVRVVDRQAA